MIIGSSSTPKLVAVIVFGIIGTDRASEVVVVVAAASTSVIIVRLSGPTTDRHADAIRTPPLSATTLVPARACILLLRFRFR